jgi:hypothetical protein
MGFISSGNTLTLTAKLTPVGRQRLVSTNNALISTFSLGDSDANYNVPSTLISGQVPSIGGNIGANASVSNSTAQIANIKSPLIVNSSGLIKKSVEKQSTFTIKDMEKLKERLNHALETVIQLEASRDKWRIRAEIAERKLK